MKWLRSCADGGATLADVPDVSYGLTLGIAFIVASGASGLSAPSSGQPPVALSISQPDRCPARIQSATIEAGSSTGLRLHYVVINTKQQNIEHLIVTAATVDGDERVTAVRVQTIEQRIDGRGRKEQFAVFPGLLPAPGERVVFGVLAVGWSSGQEWRGVVRLAARTTASD